MGTKTWRQALCSYWDVRFARMFLLGFSAGVPLLLVLGTYSYRLREAGISLSTIGFLSWIGLIYGFKWAWAPLIDKCSVPIFTKLLGQRRSWLLISQAALIAFITMMAFIDPREHLALSGLVALCVAFASATQDIALDAFRIESAEIELQAAFSAVYQSGYRLAMIWAGAGTLAATAWASGSPHGYDPSAWCFGYLVTGLGVIAGMVATICSAEPPSVLKDSNSQREMLTLHSLTEPFSAFFRQFGRNAVWVLLLIVTYRISDVVMGVMANPFYQDLGFSKGEIAAVSKTFGVAMTLVGAFVGGAAVLRWGVMRVLMAGAVLACCTNLFFSALGILGPKLWFLTVTVSADNLAAGVASAAFVAYLSGLTTSGNTATQYAFFSSCMLLLPKFLAGFSGVAVDAFGYPVFFILTALMGLPVVWVIWKNERVLPCR